MFCAYYTHILFYFLLLLAIVMLAIAVNVVSVVLFYWVFGLFYGFNEWFVLFVYLVGFVDWFIN